MVLTRFAFVRRTSARYRGCGSRIAQRRASQGVSPSASARASSCGSAYKSGASTADRSFQLDNSTGRDDRAEHQHDQRRPTEAAKTFALHPDSAREGGDKGVSGKKIEQDPFIPRTQNVKGLCTRSRTDGFARFA